MSTFSVGDYVRKESGDYRFEGWVDCVFPKRSGQVRYVVEDNRGVLFIFAEKNLKLVMKLSDYDSRDTGPGSI